MIDLNELNSQTKNGISIVVDTDAGTITANGTATAQTDFTLITILRSLKPGLKYTLSGSPTGYGAETYRMRAVEIAVNNETTAHYENPNGVFTCLESTYKVHVYLRIMSGVTLTNAVFKPMLRLTDTSDEFAPFTPDNHWIANRLPNIPRTSSTSGRDLTSRLSTTLYKEISLGDFSNIKPGDKIIGPSTGTIYWIAHRDLFYGYHNIGLISTHHVILLPTQILSSGQMNETNTTVGGYIASKGKTTVDQLVQNYFIKDFGNHIKQFVNFQVNATNSEGVPTGMSWYSTYGDLMSEVNVYGSVVWSNSPMNIGIQKEQFEIFRDLGTHILGGTDDWLKDATHPWNFAFVYDSGVAYYIGAADTRGFRPFAVLVG